MNKLFFLFFIFLWVNPLTAQQMPPAKVVISKVIENETAKTSQIVGSIEFNKISSAACEIEGIVDEVYIDEGDIVEKDQPLFKINPDFIEKDMEIAQKELETIDVQLQYAKKQLKRFEILFKSSTSSETEYDKAFFTEKQLQRERETQLKKIEKIKLKLDKCTVKSPFKGIVLEKNITKSDWITPNSKTCMIAGVDDIYVKVSVSENLLPFIVINENKNIRVIINALQMELTGKISSIVPVADLKSKTFIIKITIPYFDKAIRNMSATAYVPSSKKMKLPMVPRDAVILFNGQSFVYSVAGGKAVIIPVNPVVYEEKYVGVESPCLVKGMPVVIDGNDRLRPDQPVEIIGEK